MAFIQGVLGWPQTWTTGILIAGTTITLLLWRFLSRPPTPEGVPFKLAGWPVVGTLGWFTGRSTFMENSKRASPDGNFSFQIGSMPVVGLSGHTARATYFASRGLDLSAGFTALTGLGAGLDDFLGDDFNSKTNIYFKRFVTPEHLAANLHHLISDVQRAFTTSPFPDRANPSKSHVVFDPFELFLGLIYQLSNRVVGCHDIADDPVQSEATRRNLIAFQDVPSVDVIFPRLPTWTKIRNGLCGYSIFRTFSKIEQGRKKTGTRREDAMQIMMDRGEKPEIIVAAVIGGLSASLFNSAANAAWVPCYLADNDEWRERVVEQVDASIEKHRKAPDETAADILPRLSLSDWEKEFTLINLCLREAIRLNLPGTSIRKNTSGSDIPIDGSKGVIPKDAYAVYHMDDIHMDQDVYKDPTKWDPSRFLPDREEDNKHEFGYVGWGGGMHPCLGMRFAKLEITITTVFLLSYYRIQLCDKDGKASKEGAPKVQRDGSHMPKPVKQTYIKCKRRF